MGIYTSSSSPSSSSSSSTSTSITWPPPPPSNPTNPSTNPPSTPLTRTTSLLALRIASSSAFLIVPLTLTTRITHPLLPSPPGPAPDLVPLPLPVIGTEDIYANAAQTILNDARGHRSIAVEVAGEKYFTVPIPPTR